MAGQIAQVGEALQQLLQVPEFRETLNRMLKSDGAATHERKQKQPEKRAREVKAADDKPQKKRASVQVTADRMNGMHAEAGGEDMLEESDSQHKSRSKVTFTIEEREMIVSMAGKLFHTEKRWYQLFLREWKDRPTALKKVAVTPTYDQIYKWIQQAFKNKGKETAEARMASYQSCALEVAIPDNELVRKPPLPSGTPPASLEDDVSPSRPDAVPDADQAHLREVMQAALLRSERRRTLEERTLKITNDTTGRGKDIEIPDTLREALGRGSPFFAEHDADEVQFFARGAFGLVARLMKDGRRSGIVMKAMQTYTSMRSGHKQVAHEAGAMYYSGMLAKLPRNAGNALPFTPTLSRIGGDTGVVFFPSGHQAQSRGHIAIFMQEALGTFEEDAARLAALFKEPDGKVDADAFPRLAQVFRCILLGMQRMEAVGIAHGDLKPGNNLKIPASGAAYGDAVYRDFDNKLMTLVMSDMGCCKLPQVAYVSPNHVDSYDPSTRKYVSKQLSGTKRAANVQQASVKEAGSKDKLEEAACDPAFTVEAYSGPVPMSLLSLERLVGCAPSSLPPGEAAPILVKKCDAWGGTPGFMPPEAGRRLLYRAPMFSHDFIPGDMWSFAIMALQIMSGNLKNTYLHPQCPHDKTLLCELEDRVLWH